MRATIEHAGEDEINFPPVKGMYQKNISQLSISAISMYIFFEIVSKINIFSSFGV